MNELPESILIEALDLLEQGVGVEEIVARYPAQAAELRPLLLTAARLATLSTQPAVTAERRSRAAFLAAAAGQTAAPRRAAGVRWLARLLAPALAVLLVVFLGGAALAGASGSAAPGSALYEVKQFVEGARLALARDPERAAELRERFRQERIAEIEQLLARGVVADVALAGTIETMDAARWTVAGLPVDVTAAAVVDGSPVVGAWVEVSGQTAAGAVLAMRVTVVSAPPPTPVLEPTPPSTPNPSPTATALPATATPSASATPAAMTTAAPTTAVPTISATATSTLPPPPTATPAAQEPTAPPPPPATPGDDDNDNDDNENDNEPPPPATATPEPNDPTPPPPPPTATPHDDDNGNDNDDNGNGNNNDDNGNSNDNDDNGNDNHDDNGNGNQNDNQGDD